MADKKKSDKETMGTSFDLSQYLPEGVSEADFKDTSERDPQISPEILFREKIPLCGIPLGIDDMPHKPDEKPWQAIDFLLQAPVLGLDQNKSEVMVEAGKRAVLGVSGGIKSFKIWDALQRAIGDKEHVYLIILRVTGKEKVETTINGVTEKKDMWAFEMKVLWDKPIKRTPRHQVVPRLKERPIAGALPAASNASGATA